MSFETLTFAITPGWSPSVVESQLMHGVAARFAAIGASEELYELAIARRAPAYEGIGPPRFGIARGSQFDIGWTTAAGEASMLSAYAIHLIKVNAHDLGLSEDLDGAFGRFAEVRGRLAQRDERGFVFQTIRADDPHSLPSRELTGAERATWDALARGCACPVCSTRFWTAAEADAFALELEADAQNNAKRVTLFMVRTPALIRAAMLAGLHPQSPGWRRKRVWGPKTVHEAARIAQEFLKHRQSVRHVAERAIAEAETQTLRIERA